MKTKNALISGLIATAAALFAQGCAETAEDIELDEGAESGADVVESAESALNSAGQVCSGYCRTGWEWAQGQTTCWGGEYKYYFYRWNVTQDCRARIVDYCHNRGWRFGDAWWTYNPPLERFECGPKT